MPHKTTPWHSLSISDTLKILNTSHNGLEDTEISERQKEYGLNQVPKEHETTIFRIFLNQIQNPFTFILALAILLSWLAHEKLDSIIILIILVINTGIGFWQELTAQKTIESLKEYMAANAKVKRNGKLTYINARDLVPGDIIELEAGSRIPADAKVIESSEFTVDESALTGESLSVLKNNKQLAEKTALSDRTNMVFSGTITTTGRCVAVVVLTGKHTQIGQIALLVQKQQKVTTPLEKNLNSLAKIITIGILLLSLLILIIGISYNRSAIQMFELAISLSVSSIPEGLPALVAIALSFGIVRMKKKNVLVRNLPAVEVLGSADIFCTDKTGTLTTNHMTVKHIVSANNFFSFIETGEVRQKVQLVFHKLLQDSWDAIAFKTIKENKLENIPKDLSMILEKLVLASDADETTGDPTEIALIKAARYIDLNINEIRKTHKRIAEIPFSSETRIMLTHHLNHGSILKGAPEEVLKLCSKVFENGNTQETITKDHIDKILKSNQLLASEGYRVLALAYHNNQKEELNKNKDSKDFVFTCLIAMEDPPRAEARQAVEKCLQAGIRVVMITGDHIHTALTIAKRVGIETTEYLTGADLDLLDADQLQSKVEKANIYARVNSEHKLRILRALQSNGHIVGMGGDGVNDAPAIKRADLGFSVGTGTDLAKEVSDMILLDDNFASIPVAVKEGRRIYANIKNFVRLLFAANLGEVLIIISSILLNTPLMLLPIHILWINLLSDGLPAIALASDKASQNIMSKPPRKNHTNLLSDTKAFIIISAVVAFILAIILFYISGGYEKNLSEVALARAQTFVFSGVVIFELLLVLLVRLESSPIKSNLKPTKALAITMLTSLLGLFAVVEIPSLHLIFKTSPLSLVEWLVIFCLTAIALFLVYFFSILRPLFKQLDQC